MLIETCDNTHKDLKKWGTKPKHTYALTLVLPQKTVLNILQDFCHCRTHKASGVDQDSTADRLHE